MKTPYVKLRFLVLAALAGAIGAFGQAPYDWPFLLLLALVMAVPLVAACTTPRNAGLIGWAFGFGYFAHALQWIVSPFMVDVVAHGWMAPFALVLLAAGMALFWGVGFWGARKLSQVSAWPLILCLPAAEMVRGYIFTGFPWAMPSQALVGSLAGQGLAWVGPYGMTLCLVAFAVVIGNQNQIRKPVLALKLAVLFAAMLTLIEGPMAPRAAQTDHTIRLIQPNAAQRDKWDPDLIPVFFNRQLDFTAAPPLNNGPKPDLVIWSETAIPWSLDLAGSALGEIAAAGGDAPVALGVQRRTDTRYFNAMVTLGPDGSPQQIYDKHHLVPFGEYMPLGNIMADLGIHGLAARDGNGYSSGPGAKLLDFGALGKALPLICYEAVFPHDVNAAPERPAFLIQITNDAWFGKGAGPKQHLAQARMRAIEQGLPLARAANTGISAMIDPYGRVTASLPLNAAGFLDATLPEPLPPTLYSRTGDLPLAVLLFLGIIAAAFRSRENAKQS